MNAENRKRVYLSCIFAVVSLPGGAHASLNSPSLKLPAELEPTTNWRKDIVLEARSPYALMRLTKLKNLKTTADTFDLIGRDANRLKNLGAKVEKRLRAIQTDKGRRLLVIESIHRDKPLYTGYVNGPKNTYAFLASGLHLAQVVTAAESLRFPGDEPQLPTETGIGPESAMPMPEEMRDAPRAVSAGETIPEKPQPMVQTYKQSPWPNRLKTLFGWTMLLLGIGFIWRLISWAGSRKSLPLTGSTTSTAAPGSAAALTQLPPFKRGKFTSLTPLPLPKKEKQTA